MSAEATETTAPALPVRVFNLLLRPHLEWDRIAGEQATPRGLYFGYLLPLALLAGVCGFVGVSVFGASAHGVSVRVPMFLGAIGAALNVVLTLLGVFVLGLIINRLAPLLRSTPDQIQAHKLAVYSATPLFIAGMFTIHPALAWLSLVWLYALVLLFMGLPRVMKTPEDREIGFFLGMVAISIVVFLAVGGLRNAAQQQIGNVANALIVQQEAPEASTMPTSARVSLPGGLSVDAAAFERVARAQDARGVLAADPERLQAQLPTLLPGGFALESREGEVGAGLSQASGLYRNGDARMTITLAHMPSMAALAATAQASSAHANASYSRATTIDGRIFIEELGEGGASARYAVVGRGVTLSASGEGVTIDQARAAVETISIQRLENEFRS
jgi:hypothetical protein